MTVATTIVSQLGHSTGRLSAMIGAKDFASYERAVSFRFKASARNGANGILITLDPSDTYTVRFLSIRSTSVKTKGKFEDVYAENLKPLFESETGLRLSL